MAQASHNPEGKGAEVMKSVLASLQRVSVTTPEDESKMRKSMETDGMKGFEDFGQATDKQEGKAAQIMKSMQASIRRVSITPEDESKMRKSMETDGMKGFEDFIRQKQSGWKDIPVKIGIVGLSGAGKSSFINSIRGLRPMDKGGARTGVKQTTTRPTPYPHPDNENLVLWDLPGVGTPEYPKETYFENVDFKSYDFFLILSSGRFRVEDIWLGNQIVEGGKQFFYVRTKVDFDIDNHRRDYGGKDDVEKIIRDDMADNLKAHPDYPVFLVNNHNCRDFDFLSLAERLLKDFPQTKREALILTLSNYYLLSKDIIQQKVDMLRKGIWTDAWPSAGIDAIPIPGCSAVADTAIVARSLNFYYKQLGLTREALLRTAEMTGTDIKKLEYIVNGWFPPTALLAENILKLLTASEAWEVGSTIEELAKFVPIVGTAVSSSLSFGTVYYVLYTSLQKMHSAALDVAKACINDDIYFDDDCSDNEKTQSPL